MATKSKKKLSGKELRDAQKKAKQRKMLIILAPVLLLLVVFQGSKLLGGDEEADPAEATATSTAESDGGAPPAEGEAPVSGTVEVSVDDLGGLPDVIAAPPSTRLSEVPNSDPLAEVDATELVSFSTFVGDDPFVQLVEPAPAEAEAEAVDPEASEEGEGEPGSGDNTLVIGLAILEINGEQEVVELDGGFPADEPAFKLTEIQGTASIEFGLLEGSFSSGIDTLDLEVGKSITLVSQPDGFRYTIRLVQIAGDAGTIESAPADPTA
jgi:hypothetical protein